MASTKEKGVLTDGKRKSMAALEQRELASAQGWLTPVRMPPAGRSPAGMGRGSQSGGNAGRTQCLASAKMSPMLLRSNSPQERKSVGVVTPSSRSKASLQNAMNEVALYKGLDASVREGAVGSKLGLSKGLKDEGAALDVLIAIQRMNPTLKFSDTWGATCLSANGSSFLALQNAGSKKDKAEKRSEELSQKKKLKRIVNRRKGSHEYKQSRLFVIPPGELKYAMCILLNTLWKEYMAELVRTSRPELLQARFLNADRHGCDLSVVQARNPTFVGCRGIVVKETAERFTIISVKDIVKVIPKEGCVFSFQLGDKTVTLFGNNIRQSQKERDAAGKIMDTIEL